MKEEILRLRAEGKSYNEIKAILNCSKGTIAYHCGEGQKEKTTYRTEKFRASNILSKNISRFKSRGKLVRGVRKFQKRDNSVTPNRVNINNEITFTVNDFLSVFSLQTKCYLTGQDIDLTKGDYSFDHIIPASRGGDNTLSNLGIVKPEVNRMKSDLTVDELLNNCKLILENFGYIITK